MFNEIHLGTDRFDETNCPAEWGFRAELEPPDHAGIATKPAMNANLKSNASMGLSLVWRSARAWGRD